MDFRTYYPTIGLKLGGEGWLFILIAAASVSLGSIEWLIRKGRDRISLSDPTTRKSIAAGLVYTLISSSMFFLSRAQYSPLDFIGFSKGAIILLIIASILFILNFLVAAVPTYLALKKNLYLPLTAIILWLGIGLATFQQISGGLPQYGIWPPQPDYALKPMTPLVLTFLVAKLEQAVFSKIEVITQAKSKVRTGLSKNKTQLAVAILVVVAIGVFSISGHTTQKEFSDLSDIEKKAAGNPEGGYPRLNYSYRPEKEWLVITNSGNPLITETGGIYIGNKSHDPRYMIDTSEKRFEENNIWARTGIIDALTSIRYSSWKLALKNFGHSGISEFPVRKGDTLKIRKDSTDSDGDGRKGIENNETISLYTGRPATGQIEKFAYVTIVNDTARRYRVDPYSKDIWEPCDKTEKACKKLSTFR
ncbi:hypothetical protein [Candidatus Nanohalovita haloferacivicina]|uniref:hypothetical protein n=1 Tax=Candidatus Nanohalovita haloferacivicina TaxID=2978046 RepID=UPI00325FBE79|nr:hypothetical protein HBNXNv_0093 [Candidatus Nanohalobia archaeon BNXNv]